MQGVRCAVVLLAVALGAGCLSNETIPASGDGGGIGDASIVDGGAADAGGEVVPDGGEQPIDGGVLRHYSFRALSGVSMGASATGFIGGRHPDKFDFVGALGGYINMVYLLHMIKDRKLAGFCEMDKILANLDDINDPDKNPAITCGPVNADQVYKGHVYENTEDFNHWFFADYSAEFDRSEAIEIFQDLSMGMGNAFFHNAESPYLPSGVGLVSFKAWMDDPLRCDAGHEFIIDTPPYNCNREFNPDCEYPLVLFCDGEEPVGCKDGKCGKDNPDYYTLKGSYDPYYPDHRQPVIVMAAVDYNRNGRRDFGEPLVINYGERFSDTGVDGCRTVFEDGNGGCCWDEGFNAGTCERPWDAVTNTDPNHDDYDWLANPTGKEMNWLYDEGEPYEDFGVDGVKADEAKGIAADFGEGNGAFDYSPRVANWLGHDIALNFVKLVTANPKALDNIDVYIDGGIRDIFNSGVASYHAAGRMQGAGIPFKVYDHFLGIKNSVLPDVLKDGDYMDLIPDADFSPSKFGKNALVLYGKPDATDKEIKNGDGGHVGTVPQAVDRFLTWFSFVSQRWPKGDKRPSDSSLTGLTQNTWFKSKSLDGWRRFTISLPPGYGDPGNEKHTYPVVYFMHGYGMAPGDMGATGIIFQGYMADGRFQKFITVYPDGKCCLINKATGARDCSCTDNPDDRSTYLCVNAQGAEVPVARSTLPERECNGGTFYLDMVSDRYGDPASAAVMNYEGSILDLIDHVDANYRTKPPADLIAPR